MVVDHSDRLHEGVDDGGSDETEAAPLQILADRVREGGARRHLLHAPTPVLQRAPSGEAPEIRVERAELLLQGEKSARVADRGLDLEAVAHDPGVREQAPRVARPEARDLRGVEARECAPVVLAFPEDRRPGQTGLSALEDQELEQPPVVVDGNAPFLVVVAPVELAAQAPGTAPLRVAFAHGSMIPSAKLRRSGRLCWSRSISEALSPT